MVRRGATPRGYLQRADGAVGSSAGQAPIRPAATLKAKESAQAYLTEALGLGAKLPADHLWPRRRQAQAVVFRAGPYQDIEIFRRSRLCMKRDRVAADDQVLNAVRV